MSKGILKKKRTRLVALLAALCAFLAVGIGAGAAATSRAATGQREGSETGKTVIRPKTRIIEESPSQKSATLAYTGPLSFCNSSYYYHCEDLKITPAFNSSAQVNNWVKSAQMHGGWAGNAFNASITLGKGLYMPITMPVGLWIDSAYDPDYTGSGTFQNPNSLTPGQIEAVMLNGGYMGAVSVLNNYNGALWSFLGGVEYNGEINQSLVNYVNENRTYLGDGVLGIDYPLEGSLQAEFQSDCNNSELLNNSYFSRMAKNSTSELSSYIASIGQALYQGDEKYYGGVPSSLVESELSKLKAEVAQISSKDTVEEYQKAFEAFAAAAGKNGVTDSTSASSPAYQEARQAYLDAIKGTTAAADQPLLCLAAWNDNVGYSTFPAKESLYGQGSNKPGSWFENGTGGSSYPYAYYGIGPSYEGTGTDSDSTLAMSVSGTATNFLEYVLGPQSNSNQSNGGIYLTAFYNTAPDSASYSSSGTSALVDIAPSQGGGAYGTGIYVQFQSLGQDPTNVNPTSGVTLSTSSPSSDGLYFEAVSQSGEPLKSVRMELLPKSIYYWNAWDTTPIAPAKNTAPSTADGHQTWPYSGGTYWAGYYNPVSFTAQSLTSQPGWFDFSGVGAGTYDVVILGGTTESGQEVSYGSYYQEPTFQIDADHGYSSPETISAVHDPCGFVNPSEDEVVVGAANPSSSITQGAASPKSGTKGPYTATVGSSNPFTYQAEAYMPFDLSGEKNYSGASSSSAPLAFTLSLPEGETLNQGSVEVNGKSLSSLGVTPSSSSSSGISFSLSPADISSVGSQGGTIDVTFTAYLDPSFTSPGTPKYEFAYKAYSTANSGNSEEDLAAVSTNGPANNSVPSSLTTSAPSSSTGLWFKSLNADGSASTGAKFLIQNSSGQYLEEDTSSGAFSGWSWTSSPSSALEFSRRNADAVFSFGGLQDGTYTVTLVSWPDSMGKAASTTDTGKDNWPNISPSSSNQQEWAGYPGAVTGNAGYKGSFQVTLSYSSPEAMATQADPAGLVDSSQDSIYSLSPVKMAPLVGGSLSSQAYQTETVGVPFTEGWEGYLPMAVTSPTTTAGQNGYASELDVSFPEKDSGLNKNGNSSGLEMSNPTTSNIEVAGIPLSTLVSNGAVVTTSNSDYSISLPYQALEYLEDNGKNAAGDSLSSSSNRLILISFPAVMETSFKNGGQFQQWMALGSGWWNQNAGSGWGVYSSPLYTNGPADNSVPSSLSPSENSSNTGIWFKSLWYNTSTPATGSKYTVQNSSGKYLAPQESSDGTFEGWSWTSSPYDFSEQNSSAVFSFGGLSDGDYTLTQVDPAKGATASTLSFTSSLSYSSPQGLKAVKDSLNLLDSSKDTVWAMVVPSSLPFTGGKMILLVSLSAVVLFGAGAIFFILRKRRRA